MSDDQENPFFTRPILLVEFTEVYKIEADFEKQVESNFEQMIENALAKKQTTVAASQRSQQSLTTRHHSDAFRHRQLSRRPKHVDRTRSFDAV